MVTGRGQLLLASLDGVRAVPLDPSVPPTILERHELDLEWSWDQISWQPMVP